MPISSTSGAASNSAFGSLQTKAALPRFRVDLPSSKVIQEGDTITLTTVAAGSPAPTYQWYFNNNLLEGETSSTLSGVSDPGTYKVIATNNRGEAVSTQCTFSVASSAPGTAPTIITQPVSVNIVRGATAVFSVFAVGAITLNYEWYENGQPLQHNMSTLYVNNTNGEAYLRDGYTYKCKVYNTNGEVFSNEVTLNFIGVAPTITSVSSDVNTYEDAEVNLSITATGYPEPLIEWFRPYNQTTVTGSNLTFIADHDIYPYGDNYINYRVSNIYGQVGGRIEVNIQETIYPVAIQPLPLELEVEIDPYEDKNITLSGEWLSNPPVSLTLTNTSSGQTITSATGNYLQLNVPVWLANPNYSPPAPGSPDWTTTLTYNSNLDWLPGTNIPADNVIIYLVIKKPIVSLQPPEYVIVFNPYLGEGEFPNITCSATSFRGQEGLVYEWYYENSLNVIGTGKTLYIPQPTISQNDRLIYCRIYNAYGVVETRRTLLKVATREPHILVGLEPKEVTAELTPLGNHRATVSYTVEVYDPGPPVPAIPLGFDYNGSPSYPRWKVLWYINDEPYISDFSTEQYETLLFRIPGSYNFSSYGVLSKTFDCEARHLNFTVTAEVVNLGYMPSSSASTSTVNVVTIPSLIEQPQDITVELDEFFFFETYVCSFNNYVFQWYWKTPDGQIQILHGATDTFYIARATSVSVFNGLKYFCIISRPDGSLPVISREALLTVTDPNY